MALINDRPENLPSSNALDDLPDDLLGPIPAAIELAGKTLKILERPPGPGETIDLMIRLRVYDVGTAYGDNGKGEPAPYCKTKLIDCWLPSDPAPPNPDEEQPGLFDEEGEPTEDPEDDEPDNVARPDFSDRS